MKIRHVVPLEKLRRTWDPSGLGFRTTEDLPALEGLVGQDRAVAAMQFGLTINRPGYNIYVAGPAGTGKTSYTRSLVHSHAVQQPVPQDWVYVYNFDRPDEPLALALPAGASADFAQEVEELIDDVRRSAGRALDGKEYRRQRDTLVLQFRTQVSKVMQELEDRAGQTGFTLAQTERGLMPIPTVEGQALTDEQYAELPPEAKREITAQAQHMQRMIAEAARRSFELEKALQRQLRRLNMQVVQGAATPVVDRLRERYESLPEIVRWLNRVEAELVGFSLPESEHSAAREEAAATGMHSLASIMFPHRRPADPFARFRVNVFVRQRKSGGAPVVIEPNPTYANLFGKAEFLRSPEGQLEEGLMRIKPGAIHRANGGYLILQAADVLRSPFSWEALKRALTTREARIEVTTPENRLMPVEVMRPKPIPLNLKVILIGSSGLYRLLYATDEGFRKQFKLKAEFEPSFDVTDKTVQGYASFISQVCRRENLKHFTAAAVSRVLEHSHRLADDQSKFSARFNDVVEVIYEADAWATQEGAMLVDAAHVRRAIREKADRSALTELRLQELIGRGTILVDVDGAVVGQVNGLTVMSLGDHAFGAPSRITARVYMGRQGILHIEREIAMSGQIHDKGLLTLSAYLGDRFAQNKPLTFSASIAFEQTYVPVDGDSASCTELYALLSALAGVPIDQGIAVTGSVNQRGQVQPIGGVNEKIEGFFRVCQILGMTGRQGVLIPARNIPNLALADEVVEAVRAGQFHIWAVDSIEEGIEILTGIPAGEIGADGRYPPGSIFDRVDRRIEELSRKMQEWTRD